MFGNAESGAPGAAFRIVNDPIQDFETIRQLVRDGYLVRTRADANTTEARSGDTARRDRAFASGAHYISTDYYVTDERFGNSYVVEMPGGEPVRCNPVRPGPCVGGIEP